MTDSAQPSTSKVKDASKPKKRFIGRSTKGPGGTNAHPAVSHQIPPDVLEDPLLNEAIRQLPSNYSFEIHKTVHQIRKYAAKTVGLQMPEGLLMFATTIADIIERFTDALTVIMGDVTYGACCIDDYTAIALGCDMLVHYGHSCLVPIDTTKIRTLYVFVEIGIDASHLIQTIRANIPPNVDDFATLQLHQNTLSGSTAKLSIDDGMAPTKKPEKPARKTKLALVSTIQFVAAIQTLHECLCVDMPDETDHTVGPTALIETSPSEATSSAVDVDIPRQLHRGAYETFIPRSKPLSPGEILGCTAPLLPPDADALIYVGDGRFHLESIMIANPRVPAFRYDPYSKKLTAEGYNHEEMRAARTDAVRTARKSITEYDGVKNELDRPLWGVVLGTLGRQGNFKQLEYIMQQLEAHSIPIPFIPILISELSPAKLALFPSEHISTFVQTSCPRLSIDWGYAFPKPLLSPYEASVTIGTVKAWDEDERYPMDFYDANGNAALARRVGRTTVTT